MNPNLDELQDRLRGLQGVEALVVEFLAVLGRGGTPDFVQRAVWTDGHHNGFLATRGRRGVKPELDRLVQARLLVSRSGYYACAPFVQELAARQALRGGRFEGLRRVCNGTSFGGTVWDPGLRILADLREALFRQDLDRLAQARRAFRETAGGFARDPLAVVCGDPFDADLLDGMEPTLRLEVAEALLEDDLLHGRSHGAFRAWLLDRQGPGSLLAPLAALVLLLDGRLTEGRAILAGCIPKETPVIFPMGEGLARILEGRAPDAPPCFEEAMAALRRRTGKRTLPLPGFGDVLWGLALIARREPGDLATLDLRVERMAKLPYGDPRVEVARELRRAAAPAFGLEASGQAVPAEGRKGLHPLGHLCLLLGEAWSGRRVSEEGLPGAARALDDLSLRAFGGALTALADGVPHPVADLVRPVPAWERALETLVAMGGAPKAPAKIDGREVRIAWRVVDHAGDFGIEAWEQRRDARGGWTKGRRIPLKRLATAPNDCAGLGPQDLPVLACIGKDRYWSSTFRVDWESGLLALVGHPAVIWADAPGDFGRPVELVRGQFCMRLTGKGRNLVLALDPDPEDGEILLVREGPSRVLVFQPEEVHLRLRQVLGKGLAVPAKGRELVMRALSALAPLVAIHSDLGLDEGSAQEAGLEALSGDPALQLTLVPAGAGLRITVAVRPLEGGPLLRPGHGAASLVLESGGRRVLVRRDLEAEQAALEELLAACPLLAGAADGEGWLLGDPEDCLATLLDLEPLRGRVGLHWPKGQPFQTPARAQLGALRIQVQAQGDWFKASGGLQVDEDRVLGLRALLDLLGERPGRFVPLGDGRFLALTRAFRKRMEDLRALTEGSGREALRIHPLAALALEHLDEGLGAFQADGAWKANLDKVRTAMAREVALPPTFQAELRPYQREGYQWLARLAEAGLGACLADDMGLGKTVQALALLAARARRGPALVVAPTSVAANWIREAARFAPSLRVLRYGQGDREAMLRASGPMDLVVATYGLLQQDLARFEDRSWATVILDEAQAIKNAATKRSQAAMALTAECRVITTGTPVENHVLELWSLFRFINPGLLGSQESFRRRFQLPIEQDRDPEALQRLRRLVRPFLLRRTKAEVLDDLPERTEITLEVEPGPEERAFYEALRQASLEQLAGGGQEQAFQVLAALMRLRRACCHPDLVQPGLGIPSAKLEAFLDLVEELRENRHRALVFSQFTDHLALVRAALETRGLSCQYLDGSTPARARERAVDAFQQGEGDLFLISLKAGGTGLNLTAADYVIHLDPWWNPAVEDQASDRAHRIGQTRPVTIYRLVAKDTLEQRIVDLHQRKRHLADSLLEGTGSGERLDADALLALLREG